MLRSLDDSTQLCRLFADNTRMRILSLLDDFALSVAELTQITGLAQSRISTHLGKLREAGLLQDQRLGTSTLYTAQITSDDHFIRNLWMTLRDGLDDEQLARDRETAQQLINSRDADKSWADTVAGRMESQYSPGRTWEATTRAVMELIELGEVLDIASGDGVQAELLARHAKKVTCVDISHAVIEAARKRLAKFDNVDFHEGDMHDLPFEDASFDQIFAMHALSYTQAPELVIRQTARVLRPRGKLILTTLAKHKHEATVSAYDHLNLGYDPEEVEKMLAANGFKEINCMISSRETRSPYFEIITASAVR